MSEAIETTIEPTPAIETTASETPATETATPVAVANKKAVKKAVKKAAKKAPAKGAKKAIKKAAKKVAVEKEPRKVIDNSRVVAKFSNGKLNTPKVRALRAIRKGGGKQVTVPKIADLAGFTEKCRYGSQFLDGLNSLAEEKLVRVEQHEDERFFRYTLLAKGKEILEKAETAAKGK